MADALITVSDASFQHDVLQSKEPVIVDLWAAWCPPCRAIAPIFADLAREFQGKMTFAKLNTDENPTIQITYGVQGIPTLLFFANGELVEKLVGARSRNDMKQHINHVLAIAARN